MSDDTPTERFPTPDAAGTEPLPTSAGATEPLPAAAANDGVTDVPAPAATEVLYTPSAAPARSSAPTAAVPQERNSRAMLYTLIGVGAALLIAVVIVVIMLLSRGSDVPTPVPTTSGSPSASPSASPSPSPLPSLTESPEPEPEPPATVGPTFDSFTAPPAAGCAEGDTAKPLTFSWSSSNAQTAYIGVATTDAKAAPYEAGLPPVDTYTLDYQCSQASQVYTVTLEDADGNLAHQTVTITK